MPRNWETQKLVFFGVPKEGLRVSQWVCFVLGSLGAGGQWCLAPAESWGF